MSHETKTRNATEQTSTRRHWLTHCTASLLGAALLPAMPARAQRAASRRPQVILVVGDSLSAEYGLKRGSGWVSLLEQRLAKQKIAAGVVNASISGDTTSGGRSRLPALLKQHRPTLVVIELGGNDALRGAPLAMTEANLLAMAQAAKAAGAKVLLAGMQIPPNYGRKFSEDFSAIYARVAKTESAALMPFLLKGIADGPEAEALFQADRIHPREAAQPIILDNLWPVIRPLLA